MARGDGSKGGGVEPGVEDGVVEVVLGCLHKPKSAVHLMPLSPSALSEARRTAGPQVLAALLCPFRIDARYTC